MLSTLNTHACLLSIRVFLLLTWKSQGHLCLLLFFPQWLHLLHCSQILFPPSPRYCHLAEAQGCLPTASPSLFQTIPCPATEKFIIKLQISLFPLHPTNNLVSSYSGHTFPVVHTVLPFHLLQDQHFVNPGPQTGRGPSHRPPLHPLLSTTLSFSSSLQLSISYMSLISTYKSLSYPGSPF